MAHVHPHTCGLCEASCGILVEVEGDTVTRIEGDPDDPLSHGHVCPKVMALKDLYEDPDRLRTPMRRDGDTWTAIGWEEALEYGGQRLRAIRKQHGRHALGFFVGNPIVHNYASLLYYVPAMQILRTHNRFAATSVDQLPRMLISYLLYGHQLLMPVPDVDHTDFFLMLGANPVASNGSIMTAPGIAKRLKALTKRGGRLVVVDPRRTETAALATEHLFIRPGADAWLLAALLHTIFEEGLSVPGRLGPMLNGWSDIEALMAPFSPERVAEACGVPAQQIRQLARDFAGARTAVAYGRMGTCTQRFGALASWLTDLLNIATGNLDRVGGSMFTSPAFDLVDLTARMGQRGSFDRRRSRVRGLPEFAGDLPAVTLADEIETPGEGQIKAMITMACNPVLSTPDGPRLSKALDTLEFMVSLDPYLNETSRHAHLILPPVSPLERDHYDLAFLTFAVRNTARYSPAVFAPPPGAKQDWEILMDLVTRIDGGAGGLARLKAGARLKAMRALGPRGLLDIGLRLSRRGKGFTPWGDGLSLKALEAQPHGVDLGPLEPRFPGVLKHGTGRIEAAPEALVKDMGRLEAELSLYDPTSLRLIGRRHLLDDNSWLHNTKRLLKGKDRCTLLMNPDDAAARGLSDGAQVRITSRVGEVQVALAVSDSLMQGVVSLPHGYGHDREGTRLSVAHAHAGVSVNDLTDPQDIDPLSGTAALNGLPVTVSAA